MEQLEIKEYFSQLKQLITDSEKYLGGEIHTIRILNTIFFDDGILIELKELILKRSFTTLIGYNKTTEALEQMEIFVLRDNIERCFFGVIIDPSSLYFDKYLFDIHSISQEEYNLLSSFQGEKSEYTW